MVAVYGNLMVMGIAVALFLATVNLGRRSDRSSPGQDPPTETPTPESHG